MAKITLADLTSLANDSSATGTINANFQLLEDALNDAVLYRDNPIGEVNTVQNDIDMNSYDLLNAANIYATTLYLSGTDYTAVLQALQSSIEATEANVEALYDSFDDRYLGAKASAPTLDNDGNALQTGAIYYKTGDNVTYVWTGSAWTALASAAIAAAAAASEAAAAASESAAAASASQAGIDATAASDSAVAAAASEANALTYASGASNSKIAAEAAQAAAEAARDIAVAATDEFQDQYLGAQAFDPITDLDGDPLTTGDLYFNTTVNQMYVYNGAAWEDVTGLTSIVQDLTPQLGGNLDTNGFTVDGRDVATDGTKLDGIEAGANVTDTANVTAAGALMDSEVTNLAQVKAFDSADYATAAQGTTADSALQNVVEDTTPQLGGDLDTNGNDINFGDNDKAIFGAGSDLQIYHDGANSYVSDTGVGSLYLTGSSQVRIQDDSGNLGAVFNANADAVLKYSGSNRLATTSTGVDVTGTVTADGLTVDGVSGNMAAFNGTLGNVTVSADGAAVSFSRPSTTYLRASDSVGNLSIQAGGAINRALFSNNGDISFYEDTGTTAKFFWDASAESLGIGTSSPTEALDVSKANDSQQITFGRTASSAGSGIIGADSGQALGLWSGAGSKLMTVTHSGDVGIGTSSPSFKLDVAGNARAAYFALRTNESTPAESSFIYRPTTGVLGFGTGNTERMRIDSSGNLLVGTTNTIPSAEDGFAINGGSGFAYFSRASGDVLNLNRRTTDGAILNFRKDGTTVGNVSVTASSTSYNTSSDYRLKEDWQPMAGSIDRVKALKPVNFAWKSDGSRVDGFLAHEAQVVVPEAVHGTKDAMRTEEYEVSPAVLDDEGNVVTEAVMGEREVPDYQGIDQSKLVPLLTAALQEALAKIETLETRLTNAGL